LYKVSSGDTFFTSFGLQVGAEAMSVVAGFSITMETIHVDKSPPMPTWYREPDHGHDEPQRRDPVKYLQIPYGTTSSTNISSGAGGWPPTLTYIPGNPPKLIW
jgi:hypothetical protein